MTSFKSTNSRLQRNSTVILHFAVASVLLGSIYAVAEYLARLNTDDAQEFIPLLIRADIASVLIGLSAVAFEILSKDSFRKKPFLILVFGRSLFYTIVITFWLAVVNSFWAIIDRGTTFGGGLIDYIGDESYPINLVTILFIFTIILGLKQVDSLHRKGELLKFIMGKYHQPQEVNRIFCFIDLKGSTTIGENLGHLRFGMFLKDYYSDITDAIRETDAEIYQYVGDEIILSWSYGDGLKNNNMLICFFMMEDIINNLKSKYLAKYGFCPEFRAGLHGGDAIVTWVGELKKEIVYIGDVLNTTARIQEDCKRLSKDFLISGDLLDVVEDLGNINASFEEEIVPRGRQGKIKLYSLALAS